MRHNIVAVGRVEAFQHAVQVGVVGVFLALSDAVVGEVAVHAQTGMHAVHYKVGRIFLLRFDITLQGGVCVVVAEFGSDEQVQFAPELFLQLPRPRKIRPFVDGRHFLSVDGQVQTVVIVVEMFGNAVPGKSLLHGGGDHFFDAVPPVCGEFCVRVYIRAYHIRSSVSIIINLFARFVKRMKKRREILPPPAVI